MRYHSNRRCLELTRVLISIVVLIILIQEYTEFWGAVRRLILYFETFIQNIHEQLHTEGITAKMEDILKYVAV